MEILRLRRVALTGALLSGAIAITGCTKPSIEVSVPPEAEDVTSPQAGSNVREFYFSPEDSKYTSKIGCIGREEKNKPDGSAIVTCKSNFLYRLIVSRTD